MELNEQQKKDVAAWFAAGASLDEIQKRIKAEFGVHMTYLDLRLMVSEMPQPAEPEAAAEGDSPAETPDAADGAGLPPESAADAPADDAANDKGGPSANVTVEIDALTIPGTVASGDVTFTDGTKGKWYLDRYGRLGLDGVPQGFRPSPEDAAMFQSRLMELLRSRGMM